MTIRDRLILLAPLVGLAALDVAPVSDQGLTLCPIALVTGVACPGCGMLRGLSRLIDGDLGAALTYHPLVLVSVALGAVSWAWFLLGRLERVGPFPPRVLSATLTTTTILLVGVWVFRLTTGTLPPV